MIFFLFLVGIYASRMSASQLYFSVSIAHVSEKWTLAPVIRYRVIIQHPWIIYTSPSTNLYTSTQYLLYKPNFRPFCRVSKQIQHSPCCIRLVVLPVGYGYCVLINLGLRVPSKFLPSKSLFRLEFPKLLRPLLGRSGGRKKKKKEQRSLMGLHAKYS